MLASCFNQFLVANIALLSGISKFFFSNIYVFSDFFFRFLSGIFMFFSADMSEISFFFSRFLYGFSQVGAVSTFFAPPALVQVQGGRGFPVCAQSYVILPKWARKVVCILFAWGA